MKSRKKKTISLLVRVYSELWWNAYKMKQLNPCGCKDFEAWADKDCLVNEVRSMLADYNVPDSENLKKLGMR